MGQAVPEKREGLSFIDSDIRCCKSCWFYSTTGEITRIPIVISQSQWSLILSSHSLKKREEPLAYIISLSDKFSPHSWAAERAPFCNLTELSQQHLTSCCFLLCCNVKIRIRSASRSISLEFPLLISWHSFTHYYLYLPLVWPPFSVCKWSSATERNWRIILVSLL